MQILESKTSNFFINSLATYQDDENTTAVYYVPGKVYLIQQIFPPSRL